MFYQPKPENFRAYGALDNDKRAWVLFEPLKDDPRLKRSAFPLTDDATLAKAEEIAAHWNETGSHIFRGGSPLEGDEIPTLHIAKDAR